jgi:DNA-binding MarR family transcriptional regulator
MAKAREERSALSELVLLVFRLNGQLLAAAEDITERTKLTAARWQVLGAVLREPLSVADIGRAMGLTRQSVQRLADALVEDGLCAYHDNPAHARAKLLAPTNAGWSAIDTIAPIQQAWARRVTAQVGEAEVRAAVRTLTRLTDVLASPAGEVKPATQR